jgi:hypothetical protein
MAYIAGRMAKSFKINLFVIWSEGNSAKPVIGCRVLGGADKDKEDGVGAMEEIIFLHQLENMESGEIILGILSEEDDWCFAKRYLVHVVFHEKGPVSVTPLQISQPWHILLNTSPSTSRTLLISSRMPTTTV